MQWQVHFRFSEVVIFVCGTSGAAGFVVLPAFVTHYSPLTSQWTEEHKHSHRHIKFRSCLFICDGNKFNFYVWSKFSPLVFILHMCIKQYCINYIGYRYVFLGAYFITLTIVIYQYSNCVPSLWTECLWLIEKWCKRGWRREVMKTVCGGSGVFGVSHGKAQPTGNPSWQPPPHQPSGCAGRLLMTRTEC